MVEENTPKSSGEIPPMLEASIEANQLSKKEQFVLEEYKTAVRLTFDVDNQRNTITKFYLLFAGVAVSGVVFMVDKGSIAWFEKSVLTAELLLGIGIIGFLTVAVLARLRRVQIEHFGIINSIREYFLKNDPELKEVIQLSIDTLPTPNIQSGTFFWLCIVMFVNAAILSCSSHIGLVIAFNCINVESSEEFYVVVFIIAFLLETWLYFGLTKVTKK